ncbi:hypothetical protein HISP_11855 [Haloarcula hispanica N601]|uniref:DUF7312 domain-containing protein n=3 Tax=Haloarcula hispanica TaxID=51589 RepID=V5TPU7_HALHI|nr:MULTISPECIES: hypothetical protein [Haloarcula]AEM57916.1 conserved hypothetical protein [Haloarcula hispanica ATCC 33960]AHB66665.1 hypothetical protein HISP_11855 [Haloarcula hispanica N601]MCJ0619647.1 hypothetical protein [Haloarcula hispanica]MUV50823.1 hypothetical protein [Haloarcula sp. CBA1122]RYJ10118.1 hypothetical protein ELS20_08975 [Haloarcula hispanica]
MDDDGAARDDAAATGDTFTEEYELATEADMIQVDGDAADTDAADEEEGAVAGSFAPDLEVTPDAPKPENVVFVALGVCIAILALGRMFLGAEMYTPSILGGVVLSVALGTAVLYGFFVRTSDA